MQAGVLLELLKDLLYQAYVRRGKLQQATMVRRFFADETLDKITPIGRATPAKTIDATRPPLTRARRARCGTSASSRCPRPSRGCHEFCTVRNTRSGCGIRIVARPSRS